MTTMSTLLVAIKSHWFHRPQRSGYASQWQDSTDIHTYMWYPHNYKIIILVRFTASMHKRKREGKNGVWGDIFLSFLTHVLIYMEWYGPDLDLITTCWQPLPTTFPFIRNMRACHREGLTCKAIPSQGCWLFVISIVNRCCLHIIESTLIGQSARYQCS